MPGRSSFATGLPDIAEGLLTEAYFEVELSLAREDGGFRLAFERFDTGPFQFDEMLIGAHARFGYEPIDEFLVTRVRGGRLRLTQEGIDERFRPGELGLIGRAGVASTTEVDDLSQAVVKLGAGTLRVAAGFEPGDERLPTFTSVRPASTQRARTWLSAAKFVGAMLAADPDVATAPLVIGSTNRMLAGLLLATFPNLTTAPPRRRDDHDGRASGTIQRAIAFIDANADLDIGIADIATAARVSRRATQLAFRRHLATTPTAYLRRVRLDLAHGELLAASPGGLTVTEVAYRWGFSSPSRFAERYRAAFDRSPSETLRR